MIVRIILLVMGLAIAGLVIAWLTTGEKRYLRWSLRLLVATLALALLFFVALFISHI